MTHAKDITLHLVEVEQLFTIPAVTPFSPEWRNVSGVEVIYRQWLQDHRPQTGRLTLYLAADSDPNLATDQIREAIQRYSYQEIEQNETEIKILRRVAHRSAIIGLAILAFFLSASVVIDQFSWLPDWLNTLLHESFIVAAWVAMWRPAELFLYEWRPNKLRIYFLQYLRAVEIEVKPGSKP